MRDDMREDVHDPERDPELQWDSVDPQNEEASMWLTRINRGLRPEEVDGLREWLKAPKNRHAILDMARLWHEPDIIAILCEVFPQGPEPIKTEFWRGFASIALKAALVVGLVVFAVTGQRPWSVLGNWWSRAQGAQQATTAAAPKPLFVRAIYSTAIGERREIQLPDDTTVQLNTGTRMVVAYSLGQREIVLPYGEATFHVAHEENRPFLVRAGSRRFEAVGTNFNVRVLTPENVALTVTEGNVRVLYTPTDQQDTPAEARLRGNMPLDDTTVGALETALVEPSLQFVRKIEASDVDSLLAWQQGMIFFKSEPLEKALAEVDRYTTTQFVVADDRLRKVRIGGHFHTGNIEEFLITLRKDFGVDSWRDPQGHIVLAALTCTPSPVGTASPVSTVSPAT
jgi:transmembrane sensor